MRKNRSFPLVVLVMLSFSSCIALAYPPPQKKLIEAGWERPTASDLIRHQKIIEKTPYDGIVLMLQTKDDAGNNIALQTRVFEARPLQLRWFASDVEKLRKFRSAQLTDNFVRVSTSRNTPDWFDDVAWHQVVENWKVAASIARDGKLKGICFDPEMYSGAALFTYGAQQHAARYDFNRYQEKVRQRGREIIQSIASIYPDMVFFTFRMNDINQRYANNIEASRYNLYPAFINGWLDAAPRDMIFVDGGESAYTYSEPVEFLKTANWVRNTGQVLIAPENRRKYRDQVQVSFGLYLDAYSYYKLDASDARSRRYALPPLDGSRLNRLRSNVQAAVNAADEYVWTWGEHYRWWPTQTKNVESQTWEEVLPGTTEVLLSAVRPEAAKALQEKQFTQIITQQKLPNLLQNSDFSNNAPNTAKPVADWQTNGAPVGWSTWQKKVEGRQPGTFTLATGDGENGTDAVRISSVYEGFVIQGIGAKPEERYYVRTRFRKRGAGLPRLDVRFQNEHGWIDSHTFLVATASNVSHGEWHTLSMPITVPAGATKLYVLIGVSGQNLSTDAIWFDRVELYRIP